MKRVISELVTARHIILQPCNPPTRRPTPIYSAILLPMLTGVPACSRCLAAGRLHLPTLPPPPALLTGVPARSRGPGCRQAAPSAEPRACLSAWARASSSPWGYACWQQQ